MLPHKDLTLHESIPQAEVKSSSGSQKQLQKSKKKKNLTGAGSTKAGDSLVSQSEKPKAAPDSLLLLPL